PIAARAAERPPRTSGAARRSRPRAFATNHRESWTRLGALRRAPTASLPPACAAPPKSSGCVIDGPDVAPKPLPTVDVEGRAGDVVVRKARKEDDEAGDFFRCAEALERRGLAGHLEKLVAVLRGSARLDVAA